MACALHHGCTLLWTNDDRFVKAGRHFVRNILK